MFRRRMVVAVCIAVLLGTVLGRSGQAAETRPILTAAAAMTMVHGCLIQGGSRRLAHAYRRHGPTAAG